MLSVTSAEQDIGQATFGVLPIGVCTITGLIVSGFATN
jgi:hypothetical protein